MAGENGGVEDPDEVRCESVSPASGKHTSPSPHTYAARNRKWLGSVAGRRDKVEAQPTLGAWRRRQVTSRHWLGGALDDGLELLLGLLCHFLKTRIQRAWPTTPESCGTHLGEAELSRLRRAVRRGMDFERQTGPKKERRTLWLTPRASRSKMDADTECSAGRC